MNFNDKTDLLLEQLKEDSAEYKKLKISGNEREKKLAIRSLMNLRMPGKISEKLLSLQDDYLQNELQEKGIVTLSDIPTIQAQYGSRTAYADKLSIWQGDITRLKTGAIVNAANSQMLGCFVPCHRCIDNAIHSAAGMQLRAECSHIMNQRRIRYGKQYTEPTGTATLTNAYNLPCDYVIHTVGPIMYDRLNDSLRQELRNCYENVLECCVENGITSVAFCCISTGEFHFPNDEAAVIAVNTVTDFLKGAKGGHIKRVIFNVFKDTDRKQYETLLAPD